MIKALIFDLDNTLIDRQRAFREMLHREFSKITDDVDLINKMVEDIIVWDKNGEVSRDITFNMWKDKYSFVKPTPEELSTSWSNESGKVAYLYPDVRETLSKLKGNIKNSYAVFDHCLYVYCVSPYFVLYGIFIIL